MSTTRSNRARPGFKAGQVIIPKDGSYPRDALQIDEVLPDGTIKAFPMAGGRGYTFPPAAQRTYGFRLVTPRDKELEWYGDEFWLNEDGPYPGWTKGYLWNGWATPHFEKKTMLKVLKKVNADYKEFMSTDEDKQLIREEFGVTDFAFFDPATQGAIVIDLDALTFAREWAAEKPGREVIEYFIEAYPQEIDTPQGIKTVWGVGAGNWVWATYDEDDE